MVETWHFSNVIHLFSSGMRLIYSFSVLDAASFTSEQNKWGRWFWYLFLTSLILAPLRRGIFFPLKKNKVTKHMSLRIKIIVNGNIADVSLILTLQYLLYIHYVVWNENQPSNWHRGGMKSFQLLWTPKANQDLCSWNKYRMTMNKSFLIQPHQYNILLL